MATTLKKSISSDSPQCEEQSVTIKFQFLQNFSKSTTFITYYCKPFFRQPGIFSTLDVTIPNTINTHEFCPSIIPGPKFKIPSQYFAIAFWLFEILVNFLFFLHAALLA